MSKVMFLLAMWSLGTLGIFCGGRQKIPSVPRLHIASKNITLLIESRPSYLCRSILWSGYGIQSPTQLADEAGESCDS